MEDHEVRHYEGVSRDMRDEAQALNEMAEQGLSAEDQAVWESLVGEHQANYERQSEALGEMTMEKVKHGDADRKHRLDSGDHNAR